jgi:glycosyltransferase involved in cell wall biosynthesis
LRFYILSGHRIKVGITHPQLLRGGSEARAMWLLQALKDDYEVSLITTGEVDLEGLNRYYGTSLRPREFHIRQAPLPVFLRQISGADALRGAFHQRYCRKIAAEFDVLVSAYNIVDFGVPAIQCIADFSWDEEIRKQFAPPPSGVPGLFHRISPLRKLYLGVARAVSRTSRNSIFSEEDIIVANSQWTAGIIREKYGVNAEVIYPEVVAEFPLVPVEEKERGFVCIGRISSEKRIEVIIQTLKKVRSLGHDIHLHVIGGKDETAYGKFIQRMCQNESDWVVMEGSMFGDKKIQILSRHLFGIHACTLEAFGISVAEMVKAGCITFVPAGGGQVEVVDHEALTYNSVEDAAVKIDAVLRRPMVQADLMSHLKRQEEKFMAPRSMRQLRAVIEKFLNEKTYRKEY